MAPSTQVLSECFRNEMSGRRLKTGVFLTYEFDPGFFEQEVLPIFLDGASSHEPRVRVLQLEEALSAQVDDVAVYYDPGALIAERQGAHLAERRIPVRWRTGVFHPKVVLLLLEDTEPSDTGERRRSLLVATMSANLTESGWWRNIEVAHVEVLDEGTKTSLRTDLLDLIKAVKSASPPEEEHRGLEAVRKFVLGLAERQQRSSDGVLYPRIYVGGKGSVPDFLEEVLGRRTGLNLEIISPFFDANDKAGPLRELIDRFEPNEVRILLPRGPDGRALCRGTFYDAVKALERTSWARLPKDLLQDGKTESNAPRHVHAKCYRFFSRSPAFEALFVGSVNLTTAAHQKAGNFEVGILLQASAKGRPDWWLDADGRKPSEFQEAADDGTTSAGPGANLSLRYSWNSGVAHALWAGADPSPRLAIEAQGAPLFTLGPLPSGQWRKLDGPANDALRTTLPQTALLMVKVAEADGALILVDELDMEHKPSLILHLTVEEILRYWASFTPEQRAVILQERLQDFVAPGSLLVSRLKLPPTKDSFFDAFAGLFHSFAEFERKVQKAIAEGHEKEATRLLFGKKHDSLPHLLEKALADKQSVDAVRRYVIFLCARQVVTQIEEKAPEFCASERDLLKALKAQLDAAGSLRDELSFDDPAQRGLFLDWFESHFLKRAKPTEVAR